MQHPLSLTVVMTVYNGMPYMPEAVHSILAQEDTDFTFLIINNASTDGSKEWLETLQDNRLIIEHLETTLPRPQVLNLALSKVTTDLTAIIDADDVATPQRLAKQRQYMCLHPQTTLLGSDVHYIDPQGQRLGTERFAVEHDELCNKLPLYNQFAHAACMFRTQAVKDGGGYPEAFLYAQDFALWLTLLSQGARVASLPEPLACIRQHPQQATRDPAYAKSRAHDEEALCQRMLALHNLSPASRQAAFLRLAFAQRRLGLSSLWLHTALKSIRVNPVLFLCNPIFWARLRLWLAKKRKKNTC